MCAYIILIPCKASRISAEVWWFFAMCAQALGARLRAELESAVEAKASNSMLIQVNPPIWERFIPPMDWIFIYIYGDLGLPLFQTSEDDKIKSIPMIYMNGIILENHVWKSYGFLDSLWSDHQIQFERCKQDQHGHGERMIDTVVRNHHWLSIASFVPGKVNQQKHIRMCSNIINTLW